MSENTKIEWCDHTFNPWEGCQKVGPGCDHCYAETRNARFSGGQAINWGPGAPRRRTSTANWRLPLKWNKHAELQHAAWEGFKAQHPGLTDEQLTAKGFVKPRRPRVFCASLADVFDNAVDPQWRADLFSLIAKTPQLDWLLLTKRIGIVGSMLEELAHAHDEGLSLLDMMPLPNVWIGATIVNQEEADRDIPKLLALPARVRFLSMEPLLGPVDLSYWIEPTVYCGVCREHYSPSEAIPDPGAHPYGADKCAKCGRENVMGTWWGQEAIDEQSRPEGIELDQWDHGYKLNWVIVGGESGPGARPMHPDWARSLRDQCTAAGVPFLFKQWGEWMPGDTNDETVSLTFPAGMPCGSDNPEWHKWPDGVHSARVGKKAAGRLLDGRPWDEFPITA